MNFSKLKKMAQNQLFIIGEVGVNHNGDLNTAKKLIDAAKESGCDAVKFQTWITEKVYSKSLSLKPDYQLHGTQADESEYDTIKKLELSQKDFVELRSYSTKVGIPFFSTPDEVESLNFLVNLGVPILKTASQDVTNLPFLLDVAEKNLPIIFSTGACTFEELTEAVQLILSKNKELIILHCVSSYPAPLNELNLKMIQTLKELYACPVGFSDHTLGVEAACAAVALGAQFFEKHFTLDQNQVGPDHQASANPAQLRHYVSTLRAVYSALGDGIKQVMPCEQNTRGAFRRFLVSAHDIFEGQILKKEDFYFKKTQNGIHPKEIMHFIGHPTKVFIARDTVMKWEYVQG